MTTTSESAVSWGAVIAGAVGATALSLVLFLLGTGLGLAVASPWAGDGISGKAASISTILWVTLVQLLASALGGYLAGRLRTRWVSVHTDEVYFRDTAHGFIAWSVATLLMATLMSSAIGGAITTSAKAGGEVAKTVAMAGATAGAGADKPTPNPMGYYVDTLFRRAPASGAPVQAMPPDRIPEATRIFANALQSGQLSEPDRKYLGEVVATQTGVAPDEAERRVTDAFTQLKGNLDAAATRAKQAADDARKASAALALWLVVSLLVGAFIAALMGTFGGRLRDKAVVTV